MSSAPYKKLAEEFGFTPEGIVADIEDYFLSDDECDCGCGECGDHDCGCQQH